MFPFQVPTKKIPYLQTDCHFFIHFSIYFLLRICENKLTIWFILIFYIIINYRKIILLNRLEKAMKTRLRKLHNTKTFNLHDLIDENKKMMEKDAKFINELEKRLDEKLSKD